MEKHNKLKRTSIFKKTGAKQMTVKPYIPTREDYKRGALGPALFADSNLLIKERKERGEPTPRPVSEDEIDRLLRQYKTGKEDWEQEGKGRKIGRGKSSMSADDDEKKEEPEIQLSNIMQSLPTDLSNIVREFLPFNRTIIDRIFEDILPVFESQWNFYQLMYPNNLLDGINLLTSLFAEQLFNVLPRNRANEIMTVAKPMIIAMVRKLMVDLESIIDEVLPEYRRQRINGVNDVNLLTRLVRDQLEQDINIPADKIERIMRDAGERIQQIINEDELLGDESVAYL